MKRRNSLIHGRFRLRPGLDRAPTIRRRGIVKTPAPRAAGGTSMVHCRLPIRMHPLERAFRRHQRRSMTSAPAGASKRRTRRPRRPGSRRSRRSARACGCRTGPRRPIRAAGRSSGRPRARATRSSRRSSGAGAGRAPGARARRSSSAVKVSFRTPCPIRKPSAVGETLALAERRDLELLLFGIPDPDRLLVEHDHAPVGLRVLPAHLAGPLHRDGAAAPPSPCRAPRRSSSARSSRAGRAPSRSASAPRRASCAASSARAGRGEREGQHRQQEPQAIPRRAGARRSHAAWFLPADRRRRRPPSARGSAPSDCSRS